MNVGDFVVDSYNSTILRIEKVLPRNPVLDKVERQQGYLLSYFCHIDEKDGEYSTSLGNNKKLSTGSRDALKHFQEYLDDEIKRMEKARESLLKISDLIYEIQNQK